VNTFDHSASFAALAAELQADHDAGMTARAVVTRLADLVPEADQVSLTVRGRRGSQTLASTDRSSDAADALQYALGQGPCVELAEQQAWIRSGDVGRDARWPRWGPQAAALGFGSILSVQLLEQDRPYGALSLYSRAKGAFGDHDTVDLVLIYAIHAANALIASQVATSLQTALSSRHAIGMAQGIIMERYGLDQATSFALLQRLSSTTETKLRDVAAQILATGVLPEPPSDDG
jgi:hypothetical protein